MTGQREYTELQTQVIQRAQACLKWWGETQPVVARFIRSDQEIQEKGIDAAVEDVVFYTLNRQLNFCTKVQ